MKLRGLVLASSVLCAILVVYSFVVPYLRNMYIDAHISIANRAMTEIADAVVAYQKKHDGRQPFRLADLTPEFIDAVTLNPRPRYGRMSKAIIIPERPYGIRKSSNDLEITCAFFADNSTQLVMNVNTREVHIEGGKRDDNTRKH